MNKSLVDATGFFYQNLVKPIFFQFDAEKVHNLMVGMGEKMGESEWVRQNLSGIYRYEHESLNTKIANIKLQNPIGLAAGFDYDARLTQILSSMGFGYQTVGTVTAEPYVGNIPPRLGRLPKSKSLLVNKGFKSQGALVVAEKLSNLDFSIPVGVSIGSTNRNYASTSQQIEDYCLGFERFSKLKNISYFELNISCPNLASGEPFTSSKSFKLLIGEVEKLKLKKPLFIKMATDISADQSIEILKIADKYSVEGVIFGNLTKDRKNPDLNAQEVARAPKGNFSGKPTFNRSNALLSACYKKFGKRFFMIGCGGIFSAQDAFEKIQLGASSLQLITGMIYQGPQLVSQINQGLVELIREGGYQNVSEAVGTKKL